MTSREVYLETALDQQGRIVPDTFFIRKLVNLRVLEGDPPKAVGDSVTNADIERMYNTVGSRVEIEVPSGWRPPA